MIWGNQTDLWNTGHKSFWRGRHVQCQISRVRVWHKAFLDSDLRTSLRSLRWTRKVVDLRIYHDARALRKVCDNARTSGRVTEGQLYWCFFGMHKSISSALPKGTPFYLSWMPQTRSLLLKCQLEQKYILDFITLSSKKKMFFPSRDILECCKIIMLFLDSEARKFPSYLPCKATNTNHKVFCCVLNFT